MQQYRTDCNAPATNERHSRPIIRARFSTSCPESEPDRKPNKNTGLQEICGGPAPKWHITGMHQDLYVVEISVRMFMYCSELKIYFACVNRGMHFAQCVAEVRMM